MKIIIRAIRLLMINTVIALLLLEAIVRSGLLWLPDGFIKEIVEFSGRRAYSNNRVYHDVDEFFFTPASVHRIKLPAKDKKDVLFVGDSFTFGQYLAQDDAFPCLFKSLTGKNAVNLGVGGTGPQIYNRMIEIGMRYDPQTIVYCMTANDFYDAFSFSAYIKNYGELRLDNMDKRFESDRHFFIDDVTMGQKTACLMKWLTNHSKSYLLARQLLDLATFRFKALLNPIVPLDINGQTLYILPKLEDRMLNFNSREIHLGFKITVAEVKKAYRFAKKHNKTFLVVLIPPKSLVYKRFNNQPALNPYDLLKQILQKKQIPFLDLTADLTQTAKANPQKLLYFTIDEHLNEFGDKAVADAIVRYFHRQSIY